MAEDLQSLLEKINREGVEKAQAQAAAILADAKSRAADIVKAAKEESARLRAEGETAAKDYASRAAETVRQAERDTVLRIEASVTAKLTQLLAKDVDRALADEQTVSATVAEAVRGLVGSAEVAVPTEKLAGMLRAQLAAEPNFTVVTDETLGTGFSVKVDGGRVEHAFTGSAIAEELARRLRPDLAALLK